MPDLFKEWQVPPAAVGEDKKLGWLNEACEEGMIWLKSQRGISDIKKALDTIAGKMNEKIPEYRSQLNSNHLKRDIREVVGSLSKLRPIWGYGSDNKAFLPQGQMMNLTTRALYLENNWDVSIKEALQWASGTCTGWAQPIYTRDLGGTGAGSIKIRSFGAPSVLPVQLPSTGDFQQAYAVTLLDEMPIYMAHAKFPMFQDRLTPTKSMYWYAPEIRKATQGNLWNRMFRRTGSGDQLISDCMVPVRYTTVIDLAVNRTDQIIPMGEPGTSWYYEVPYVGMDIPAGRDGNGNPIFRKADVNDARLYPYRRMIISSESVVMYDGPAFNWHGRLDLIPFCLDHYPWEPLGFSLAHDGYSLNGGIQEIERGIMDKLRSQNDMPLAYDINAVTSKEAKQFDPMQPRARVGFDGSQVTKPFDTPIPPDVLMVRQEQIAFLEYLKNALNEQLAINDVMALSKARMSSDDLEKILEANGPIVEDMSRSMEPPMREIGNQVKYLILQYLTTARVMQYVGPDNMTLQTFDYDPNSIVPSHLPGEDSTYSSKFDKKVRARIFAENLRFLITPGSLHEMTQMVMKLGLIQLRKAGIAIDSETIAEAWNIRNYGSIDGATVREKFKTEKEEELQLAMRLQVLGQSLQNAGPLGMMAAMVPPGAAAPGKNPEGRPPSGQAAPALEQKDGNTRSTITESKK